MVLSDAMDSSLHRRFLARSIYDRVKLSRLDAFRVDTHLADSSTFSKYFFPICLASSLLPQPGFPDKYVTVISCGNIALSCFMLDIISATSLVRLIVG